jgi:lysophospholipase L1-like esterase
MPPWFDAEVAALEARSRARSRGPAPVLFYGSSTFTLWHDAEARFAGDGVVNHGFGGATLADCLEYFDRLVTPFVPRALILYAGDNDLDNGSSPETVLALLEAIIARKRAALGAMPLAFVSIKISRARLPIMHTIAYLNRIAARRLEGESDCTFVDFTRRLVGRGYESWLAYYSEDALHMNEAGYRVLAQTLREYLDGPGRGRGNRPRPGDFARFG